MQSNQTTEEHVLFLALKPCTTLRVIIQMSFVELAFVLTRNINLPPISYSFCSVSPSFLNSLVLWKTTNPAIDSSVSGKSSFRQLFLCGLKTSVFQLNITTAYVSFALWDVKVSILAFLFPFVFGFSLQFLFCMLILIEIQGF